jgi:cell wall-associated NlpC family hydrolase
MRSILKRAPIVAGAFLLASATSAAQVRVEVQRRPSKATRVLTTAQRYVGTKYVFGGTSPRGFDCSGFVQYVFRKHGVRLPRTSRQQAVVGRRVAAKLSGLRPGDLLLFATGGSRIDHVAIYAGKNRIIHSSASGGGVRYDHLSSKRGKWLAGHHVASRRVLSDGTRLVAELASFGHVTVELPGAAADPEGER